MQPVVLRKNILQYYCSLRFYNKIAITIKKSNNYYCNIVQYIDNILQYFELVQSRYNKQEIDDKYISSKNANKQLICVIRIFNVALSSLKPS